jgi:general stress protein CsbA
MFKMQYIVTIALLVPCLYVILFAQSDASTKNWAMVTTGTLIGYWFKGAAESQPREKEA